jgi:putative cardiolipin synthase
VRLTRKLLKRWLTALLAAALVACAPLQPVELPPESALPPSAALLWTELAQERPGEWYLLLNEGKQALDWRLRAIDSARESIDLQTFLWTLDAVGTAMIDHLLQAADRGVRVRILVDDSFVLGEDEQLMYLQQHANISYRIYNPYRRRSDSVATRQALNLAEFHRLDHRMHNKAMIVDGRVAIVGGRNLADEYFGLHGEANFRDLELLAGGPVVGAVAAAFDTYWNDHWSIPVDRVTHVRPVAPDLSPDRAVLGEHAHLHEELDADGLRQAWLMAARTAHDGKARLLVDRPPDKNPAEASEAPVQVAHELARLFDEAEREIVIVSAYLIPTPNLEGAVQRAIARGARVRILTNSISSNNHITAHSAYRNHIGALLGNGAELYEVRADAEDRALYMLTPAGEKILSLHAKALAIDEDRIFIGSVNLDPRSLRINTEMGLLVDSPTLNQQLRASLEPDFAAGNAWSLQYDDDGRVTWVSGDIVLSTQPASSFMQRIEDWMFAQLPLEDEL